MRVLCRTLRRGVPAHLFLGERLKATGRHAGPLDGGAVDEHRVEMSLEPVGEQRVDVLLGVQPPRLPLHVGHGADVNLGGLRAFEGVEDAGHQQVRDHRGEQGPRAEHHDVRVEDRLHRRAVGLGPAGGEPHAREGARARSQRRLAAELQAVPGGAAQHHVVERRGKHPPVAAEHAVAQGDRLDERARLLRQGGDEQVAERVVVAEAESVLEGPGKGALGVVGHGHEALPDVARRIEAHLLAQQPGRPPVVGHGDDGAHRATRPPQGADRVRLAGAAADGDGPRLGRARHRPHLTRPPRSQGGALCRDGSP